MSECTVKSIFLILVSISSGGVFVVNQRLVWAGSVGAARVIETNKVMKTLVIGA